MRMLTTGLAGLVIALGSATGGLAQSVQDEIQDSEQPGSEIEIDVEGGGARIHRKDGEPLLGFGGGATELELPAGPTTIPDIDPIDDELPGEGPENLSGPFDEDPLPE
jgi:hypothetical protein